MTLKTDPFFLGDQRRIMCQTSTVKVGATCRGSDQATNEPFFANGQRAVMLAASMLKADASRSESAAPFFLGGQRRIICRTSTQTPDATHGGHAPQEETLAEKVAVAAAFVFCVVLTVALGAVL